MIKAHRAMVQPLKGSPAMPGKADIVTYIILGAFVLAIIVWEMMNTGYTGPG